MNISEMLRVDTGKWPKLPESTGSSSLRKKEKGLRKLVAFTATGLEITEWSHVLGEGECTVGQRWVTVCECWGVTLNLGQLSRNIGIWVYLPFIRYIKFWMDAYWPETWGGQFSLAALGRLLVGFGPAEQSPLFYWSSHRLLARPAQNPVSSDFLCSCIIFPCFLNGCPQCGGSSLTRLAESRTWREDRDVQTSPRLLSALWVMSRRDRAPLIAWPKSLAWE